MSILVRSSRRQAFTLLEVILAVSISAVLLAGLYVAISMQFQHARVAREVTEESAVVRALLEKITNDFSPIQGPVNPFLNASGAYVNSAVTTSPTGPSVPASGTSGSSGGSGGSTNSSSTTNTNVVNVAMTNVGVMGESDWVVFTVSRIPKEAMAAMGTADTGSPVCDLRRISYSVVPGIGLVRKVDPNITDPNNIGPVSGPDVSDPKEVVCPEVTDMKVEYWGDTGSWEDSWDGTMAAPVPVPTGSSNSPSGTQKGPPGLIRFTFTLTMSSAGKGAGRTSVVCHTVAVRSANRWVASTTAPEASSSAP